VSEATVKTHLIHVFEKLDVRDRTRAVTKAMELGLLPSSQQRPN
jgi:ATP/maltotriose-dependent transcriptional regulator MalT